ncbi:TPA: hypothetical protein J8O62_002108 [Enterococcus faecium]|nr:hypothetical protein [Enterococcus faecium]HAP6169392.1 hypothetical protein [Enterococcus faecium]HAP8044905.1 hypothetical protein [Enterococcus faecium]HAQ8313367.1 hypothetical protein [Enterococcus faecium]HAQ8399457.1 hypothetical protein [Enterococcus faecium]HAQ8455322.1 hypothetical protein [Enterococcus faecium]
MYFDILIELYDGDIEKTNLFTDTDKLKTYLYKILDKEDAEFLLENGKVVIDDYTLYLDSATY